MRQDEIWLSSNNTEYNLSQSQNLTEQSIVHWIDSYMFPSWKEGILRVCILRITQNKCFDKE